MSGPGATRPDVPRAVRVLVDAGLSLLRTSSSGRVGIARLAGLVDPEAVPASWRPGLRREVEAARAAACVPLEPKQIGRELRGAWGRPPEKVLDELDPEPLAVTPAAQVHRAVLDGAAVAVKVRRPGLAGAVRGDLALLDALARPLGGVFGAADAGALLREARERVLDELDLEHEGSVQRQVGRALRRAGGVRVPAVHGELSAPAVLVTELLDGPTLAEARPEDPGAVARTLVRVQVGLPRAAGLALADLRPNHVVLCPDGTVGLLGTGAARAVDRERIDPALDAIAALRGDDDAAFAAAVAALGHLPADAARAAYPLADELLGDLVRGPARLDAATLAEHAERAIGALPRLMDAAARVTPDPADLWVLRGLGQLAAVLAGLEVTEDWAALTVHAGRRGPEG